MNIAPSVASDDVAWLVAWHCGDRLIGLDLVAALIRSQHKGAAFINSYMTFLLDSLDFLFKGTDTALGIFQSNCQT